LSLSVFLVVASAGLAGETASGTPTPVAGISISPTNPPLTVKFIAQASGFAGAVTSHTWTFGDGASKTTSVNTVEHTYASASTFQVSVSETDTQGESATATGTLELLNCPVGMGQCSGMLQTGGLVQSLSAMGAISPTAPADLDLFTGPFGFPNCDSEIHAAAALTDSGFIGNLTVPLVYLTSYPDLARTTCFSSEVAFVDAAGNLVHSGPLPMCQVAVPVPPCVLSINISGTLVTKVLLVPPGDPRIGAP
jgi:hypothetical protein